MARSVRPLVLLLSGAVAIACTSPDAGRSAGARAGDPRAPAKTPPSAEQLVGKWRMIAEEPADGKGGIFGQERRLLEFGADHHFHAENYIESHDGEWVLADDELVLGERYVRVEFVDGAKLVLIEDLPEAYTRDGPPRKVRNTYRRVREGEFGPMLGAEVVTAPPRAGTYASAYTYSMHKLPTMEISIGQGVRGHARLELADDGTLSGCFGVHTSDSYSESEYSSHDGQRHHSADEDRRLFGLRGEWTSTEGKARVSTTQTWVGACASDDQAHGIGPIELECVGLVANERLPADALACRIVTGPSMLEELALNPADTERAGPYTMQIEPMGHISPDVGQPWLILGASPGLRVESTDDKFGDQPEVRFVATEVDFVERNYVEVDQGSR